MKILIVGNFHHKNKEGLEAILNKLNYQFNYGNINDIENYDIIFLPSTPIDTTNFPDKLFIFGPHFSVFPDIRVNSINNVHKNCVYIQPSNWVVNLWQDLMRNLSIPLKPFPFPVNTNYFQPDTSIIRDKVFIYYKRRNPLELQLLEYFLKEKKNIDYKVFDYIKTYNEKDYLDYLKHSKYGIILDAHESQGFAIQEALSCDVPLLVWNTKTMNQEHNSNYKNFSCTTIPYWDDRCGMVFYESNEISNTFDKFIDNLDNFKPREYVLNNLGIDIGCQNFKKLCNVNFAK